MLIFQAALSFCMLIFQAAFVPWRCTGRRPLADALYTPSACAWRQRGVTSKTPRSRASTTGRCPTPQNSSHGVSPEAGPCRTGHARLLRTQACTYQCCVDHWPMPHWNLNGVLRTPSTSPGRRKCDFLLAAERRVDHWPMHPSAISSLECQT